jgi:putative Mg2+ transporter-C (MgtC) family protein
MGDFLDAFVAGFEPDVLIRMGLAVLLGGLIGIEREQRSRPAGLRTMIIVCLGATIIMIVSTKLGTQFFSGPGESVIRVDPGRIAAGIVTGIGFLGAGVVLRLGDIVRGVTTAACIWFVAALGIAIGEGHYFLSVSATILALLVLWALHFVELSFRSRVYRKVILSVDSDASSEVLDRAREILEKAGATLQDLRTCEIKANARTSLCFYIKIRQVFQSHDVVKKMVGLEGVHSVEWESE